MNYERKSVEIGIIVGLIALSHLDDWREQSQPTIDGVKLEAMFFFAQYQTIGSRLSFCQNALVFLQYNEINAAIK